MSNCNVVRLPPYRDFRLAAAHVMQPNEVRHPTPRDFAMAREAKLAREEREAVREQLQERAEADNG